MATRVESAVSITIDRNAQVSITIERNALMRAMAHLARVVERRNTIPILGNVRLSPGDRYLTLTATDLDIEARVDVDCEVQGSGDITVPAGTMNDIVRKIAEGAPVSLGWGGTGTTVSVRSGRARFSLQALPASDFPDLTVGDMTHRFTMPAATLLALIEATSFAVSTEETRYYLNGIYLHCPTDGENGSLLRGVATDGHRLARFDAPAPEGASGMPGIIVPRKTVGEIARLAKDAMDKHGNGDIEVALSVAKIRVSAANVTLTSKLIDGTFPDYQRVIPSGNDKRATLAREAFARAADRVATISSERGRAVKLSFDEGKLRLSVTNPDAGSAEEEIEAEYDEAAIDIGFNSRYLADILAALEGDTVLVKLGDPGSPTLFQKSEADNLLIVLMPMRV
jgi:DNA polymerase III subunit beta